MYQVMLLHLELHYKGDGSVSGNYGTMMIYDSVSSCKYFMGATSTGWTAGSNKFLFGKNDPASSNTIMALMELLLAEV